MKKLEKLYELARNGNKKTIDELFNMNYNYVERKAHYIYDSIINNLKPYYDELPNGLIDYEDILQDLSLRTYKNIIKYLSIDAKVMLSTYISHMLQSYITATISKKTNEIIKRLNNSYNENINFQYRDINEDRNTIFELIDSINRNSKIIKHTDFVLDIFKGYDYNQLSKKYHLVRKGLGVKIKYIANVYNNSINIDDKVCYYIKNDMVNELKDGNIYNLSYFKDIIIFTIHEIYKYLRDNYYINYRSVKNEYLQLLCTFISRTKDHINTDYNIYINNILKVTKDIYLKNKVKEAEYIKSGKYNKYLINNEGIEKYKVLELIKKGKIHKIYPYCDLINMVIEEIYIKTNDEKIKIRSSVRSTINNYINSYFQALEFNNIIIRFNDDLILDEFNACFKEKLLSKINNCNEQVLVKK